MLISFMKSSTSILILNASFIENMLHTSYATYIKHDLYADFLLRLKKSLKEFFLQQIYSLKWIRFFAA